MPDLILLDGGKGQLNAGISVLEELRVGVGDGSLRDAIVWANFSKKFGLTNKDNKIEPILQILLW